MSKHPGTSAEEVLLGFDVREMFLSSTQTWDLARRDAYLLRGDVRKPLSVDSMVWPSVFGDGLSDRERERIQLDAMHLPKWRGPHQGLWDDLTRMQASLGPLASLEHCTVAISWVSTDGFLAPPGDAGPYRERIKPPTSSAEWRVLGFDVADAGFTSGLANCGYRPAEVAAIRDSWASDLNDHHLFTNVDRAFAFKALTDRRVPEHAPFFVYKLSEVVHAIEK
jgi:hypothetical protein